MKIGTYELQVPFVTTAADSIKTILDLANITGGEKIVDLGSGDGRMVLEFAKANPSVIVHGYEIKKELVERSRQRIIIFKLPFWKYKKLINHIYCYVR